MAAPSLLGNGVGKLGEIALAQRDGELRRRLILQMVRFVDDQRVIVRQNAVARRRIGQQQRVVHDHEMRALGGATRSKEETLAALVEDARARITGAFFF